MCISRGRLAQWKNVRFVIFRPRGPRFESRQGFFFSVANLFVKRIDGNLQHRTSYINSRNLDLEKAVENVSTSEEERSLENWSYDVIMSQSDVIYTLLRYSTHTTLQPVTITAHKFFLRRDKSVDWKQAKTNKEGSSVHQYYAVDCWNRKEDNRRGSWARDPP